MTAFEGVPLALSIVSRYINTGNNYKFLCKVVFTTILFSFMVLSLGVVLQMEHANFFVVAALISNCYISFCNADESYMRGKMIELLAILFLWIMWIVIGGVAISCGIGFTGSCSRSVEFDGQNCQIFIIVGVLGFLNGFIFMCYNVIIYYHESPPLDIPCYCVFTLQDEKNPRLKAVGNIGMSTDSTPEDVRDTLLKAVGNNGVSTKEDGIDADLIVVLLVEIDGKIMAYLLEQPELASVAVHDSPV